MMPRDEQMRHVAEQSNVVRHPYTVPARIVRMADVWREEGMPEKQVQGLVNAALVSEWLEMNR